MEAPSPTNSALSTPKTALASPQNFYQEWIIKQKKWWLTLIILLVLVWSALPAIRAYTLVANTSGRSKPALPADATMPLQEIHFTATDGIHLAGWFALASAEAPTIILIHGFTGGLNAHPADYKSHMLHFFATHLL